MNDNKNCVKCDRLSKSRRQATWGYGSGDNGIMFVGEAPGQWGCDMTGIPFTGDRSGRLFQEALKIAGISFEESYTTNIVKCCPPDNAIPTYDEVRNCSQFLDAEYGRQKPALLVPVGAVAKNYFKRNSELSARMNWAPFWYKQSFTYPIKHPAYALRIGMSARDYAEYDNYLREITIMHDDLREMECFPMAKSLHLVFEGLDCTGKSTLIKCVQQFSDYDFKTKKFSKPVSKEAAKEEYYDYVMNLPFNDFTIADRSFYGEAVYGPKYRGYCPDYISDLDNHFYQYDNSLIIYCTASDSWIRQHSDGIESNGGEFDDIAEIKTRFGMVMQTTKVPHITIDMTNKTPFGAYNELNAAVKRLVYTGNPQVTL